MKTIYVVLLTGKGHWNSHEEYEEDQDNIVKAFKYQDSAIQYIKDHTTQRSKYRIEEVEYE